MYQYCNNCEGNFDVCDCFHCANCGETIDASMVDVPEGEELDKDNAVCRKCRSKSFGAQIQNDDGEITRKQKELLIIAATEFMGELAKGYQPDLLPTLVIFKNGKSLRIGLDYGDNCPLGKIAAVLNQMLDKLDPDAFLLAITLYFGDSEATMIHTQLGNGEGRAGALLCSDGRQRGYTDEDCRLGPLHPSKGAD